MPTSSSATPGQSWMRPLQVLALHHLLHRERREDIQRHPRIVPFTVAGRALDHRLVPPDAGLLRSLRDIVDVGAERDHGLPGAPRRHPRRRNAGDAALDFEALLLENAGEVLRSLVLLESELAEAEDAIDHHLRLLLHAVDLAGEVGLHGGLPFRRGLRLRRRAGRAEQECENRA